ncbi:MAG: radical SAM protein [Candidatus Sigynarchaeota archaeon]
MQALVVDALTLGEGRRSLTRDFIGAGPRMVAATLKACGMTPRICRGEDFLQSSRVMVGLFDACFVSGMTMDKPSVIAIARAWKHANPEKPVVVGGPISLEPESLLRNREIDAVVQGEAEKILFDAFSAHGMPAFFPCNHVPDGFILRTSVASKNDVQKNNCWPDLAWVERHIEPAIDLLGSAYDNAWAARVYVELLRGCSNMQHARLGPKGDRVCKDCGYCDVTGDFRVDIPNPCVAGTRPGCGFCSTAATSGPVRSFSIPYVVGQIKRCIELGCHRVVLGGSDVLEFHREALFKPGHARPVAPPPPNHDALNDLVNQLLGLDAVKRGDVQIIAENIKASLCDDESLAILARLPAISVSMGVETGSDEQLKDVGKSASISTIKHAVALLNKHGIRYHAYFIHSLPGQSRQTVQDSISMMRWLDNNKAEKITIYRFKPLPGTAFEGFRVTGEMLDEAGPMIREAMRINEASKKKYLNATVKVLIAEHDFKDRSAAIAYMLRGGPKVKLKNCGKLVNDKKIHVARITRVISDKMTEGTLVE